MKTIVIYRIIYNFTTVKKATVDPRNTENKENVGSGFQNKL